MTNGKLISISIAALKEGGMTTCFLEGREIVVCRSRDGIYALDNVCTHAHALLSEGRLRGNRLICPLHGASFDIRDGRVLGAPATQPLTTHTVTVVDGQWVVAVDAAHRE